MALALDGKAASTFSFSASGTVTLTTSDSDDVVVVVVGAEAIGTLQTVTSVTASGLTFSRRGGQTVAAGLSHVDCEIWWAPSSGALTSKVITVTMTGFVDGACLTAFGVNGCLNINSPWDTNPSLPAFRTGEPPPSVIFSTTQAHDFVFGVGISNFGIHASIPVWTVIESVGSTAGVAWCLSDTAYEIVSSAQTGATGGVVPVFASSGVFAVDALTADSAGSNAVAVMSGSGALAGVVVSDQGAAAWAGAGAFVGNVSTPVGPTVGGLVGIGKVAWAAGGTVVSAATMTGAGALAAVGVGSAPGVATWAGSGTLAVGGALVAASVATLTGSGVLAWDKFANYQAMFEMSGEGAFDTEGHFVVPQINPFWSVPINGNIVAFVAYNWITLQMFVGYEDQSFTLLDNIGLGAATQIRTAAPNAEAMVLGLVSAYGG